MEYIEMFLQPPEDMEKWLHEQGRRGREVIRWYQVHRHSKKHLLRCAELGISREDLDDMTMGMVYDMLIERSNDHEKYSLKATQEHFDKF